MKPSIGDRVLVRSNEADTVLVGTLTRFEYQHQIPVVKSEVTGEEFLCLGIVIPFDQKIYEQLNGMSGKDGWRWLRSLLVSDLSWKK